MKATIFNGSLTDNGAIENIYKIIRDELHSKNWETDSFILHRMRIAHCLKCFGCWDETPGSFVIRDDGIDVARKVISNLTT